MEVSYTTDLSHEVVDDFGIKYAHKRDFFYLLNTVKVHYKVDIDWTGELYYGITLDWNYKCRSVATSMPGYMIHQK